MLFEGNFEEFKKYERKLEGGIKSISPTFQFRIYCIGDEHPSTSDLEFALREFLDEWTCDDVYERLAEGDVCIDSELVLLNYGSWEISAPN